MTNADHEIWMRCQNIRWEADKRKFGAGGPEAAFRAAADALELYTRYAAKDAARAEGKKTSRILSGDIGSSGVVVMDAILDFADSPINLALLARYCDRDEKWVSAAIRKLRSAELIAPTSFAVRWERFQLDHYNGELEKRINDLLQVRDSTSKPLSWCLPAMAWLTLLRAAAFGSPTLSSMNFMLICGEGHDTYRELDWLRWTCLVKQETIEVDLEGLDRFERMMKE